MPLDIGPRSQPAPLDPANATSSSSPAAIDAGASQLLEPAVSSTNAGSPRVPSQQSGADVDLGSPQAAASRRRASPSALDGSELEGIKKSTMVMYAEAAEDHEIEQLPRVLESFAQQKLMQNERLQAQIDVSRVNRATSPYDIDTEIANTREAWTAKEDLQVFYSRLCGLIRQPEFLQIKGELIKIAEGICERTKDYLPLPTYSSSEATAPAAPQTLH